MLNVGVFYANGFGVKQNYKKAFDWYWNVADAGSVEAMFNIGTLFERGYIEQNDEAAFNCYLKAAKKGYPEALHKLGCFYMNGQFVDKDINRARELFNLACERGFIESYLPLGNLYYYYEPYDYDTGLKCFEIAAEINEPNGLNNLGIALQDGKACEPNHY